MDTPKGHPTRDELLAMAYADGELTEEAAAAFRLRLAKEPALSRAVAEHERLAVIARQIAPPEPMDHEWNRIESETTSRAWAGLAWALTFVGGLGVGGWACMELVRSDMGTVPKALGLAVIVGLVLLFMLTLRNRLRTLPYDPYSEVER